jgi:choline dehydrogenase-like flavoprotein
MECDVVIVGGGSAGCVLAARLSETPGLRVVLVDAGKQSLGLMGRMPAGSYKLLNNPRSDWMYPTLADPSAGERAFTWPAGRALGGGSAINGVVYTRGSRHDFDDWAANGCAGWSWDDMVPSEVAVHRLDVSRRQIAALGKLARPRHADFGAAALEFFAQPQSAPGCRRHLQCGFESALAHLECSADEQHNPARQFAFRRMRAGSAPKPS